MSSEDLGLFSTALRFAKEKRDKAVTLFREGHVARSLMAFENAVQAYQHPAVNQRDPENANLVLRMATILDPKCAEAYRLAGQMLLRAECPKEAEAVYGRAVRLNPYDPDTNILYKESIKLARLTAN